MMIKPRHHHRICRLLPEGKVLFMFENPCQGFINRFDESGNKRLEKHLVLGSEQKQEIIGLWLLRGIGIPHVTNDNHQFDYYKTSKINGSRLTY